MTEKQLHVIVHGKVQGVNFRWATYEKAIRLDLTGWVRNTPGREVEAIFEGEEEDLQEVLEFLREGPPAAHVRKVDESWSEATNTYPNFTIEY